MAQTKGSYFDAKSVSGLIQSIRQNKKSTINLNDGSIGPISNEDILALAEAIRASKAVRRVYIDFHLSDGIIGIESFRVLMDAIRDSTTIELIRFEGRYLGYDHAQVINTILLFNENSSLSLKSLEIKDTAIGRQGLCMILTGLINNKSLTTVKLSGSCQDDDDDDNEDDYITTVPTTKELGKLFHSVLVQNRTIEILSVREKAIVDCEFLNQFAIGMRSNTSIMELSLRLDTSISSNVSASMHALCDIVRYNKSLRRLDLGGNQIGDEIRILLDYGLYDNTTLTTLILSTNFITDASTKSFKSLLYHNKSLRSLSLNGNQLTNYGLTIIFEGLAWNQGLKELRIADNNVTTDTILPLLQSMRESLQTNTDLQTLIFDYDDDVINQIIQDNVDGTHFVRDRQERIRRHMYNWLFLQSYDSYSSMQRLNQGKLDFKYPNWTEIAQLIRSNKDLTRTTIDEDGRTLLHYACWKNAPSRLIEDLIDCYPENTQKKDFHRRYPLHYACENNQSQSIIRRLIEKYPSAMKEKDRSGMYPLHYACLHNQLESVLQDMILQYRTPTQEKNMLGCYPLHLACSGKQAEAVLRPLITNYPKAIYETDNNGSYPLHLACQSYPSVSVIQLLINQYPNAIRAKDKYGLYPLPYLQQHNPPVSLVRLLARTEPLLIDQPVTFAVEYPLHDACINNAEFVVMQQLIGKYPVAVQQKCTKEMYPLHYSCRSSQYESVIRLLYEEYPMASEQCDSDRYYPLHWLCSNSNLTLDSIESWGKPFCKVAGKQQVGGCTPLHLACNNRKSLKEIRYLHLEYEKAIKMKDVNGYLPLHDACENNQSYEVIEYLVNAYPDALQQVTYDGFLPLHLACAYGQSFEVIELLYSKYQDALFVGTNDGLLPSDVAELADAPQIATFLQRLRIRGL